MHMFVIERHLYNIFTDPAVHFFEHLSSPALEQTGTCSPKLLIRCFLAVRDKNNQNDSHEGLKSTEPKL